MYRLYLFIFFVFAFSVYSCGDGKAEKNDSFIYEHIKNTSTSSSSKTAVSASEKIDLISKGIGPISSLNLTDDIDLALAENGKSVFNKMCTACHRPDKKFIGPAPKGIISRRTPEWIMNMILNPEEMLRKDSLAKELLVEFNYAPMIQQNLSQDEARAILEYYRTLN